MTSAVWPNWSADSVFDAPSHQEPLTEQALGEAEALSPLLDAERLSVERQQVRRRAVVRLLLRSRPSAVSGFVVAIVVDAIKRVFRRRPLAHVGKERLEIVPSLADLDTSATPAMPLRSSGVSAATAHRIPRAVFGCSSAMVGIEFDAASVVADRRVGQPTLPVALDWLTATASAEWWGRLGMGHRRLLHGRGVQAGRGARNVPTGALHYTNQVAAHSAGRKGAMHYLTADLLKSGLAPTWAVTMDITARIGAHVFGRVTR